MDNVSDSICQSCGMPLTREDDFGTNQDGSKNTKYCTFCFQDGQFTDDGISLEQKIEKNILIAIEMGIPEENAREMAQTVLPTLKRWRKD